MYLHHDIEHLQQLHRPALLQPFSRTARDGWEYQPGGKQALRNMQADAPQPENPDRQRSLADTQTAVRSMTDTRDPAPFHDSDPLARMELFASFLNDGDQATAIQLDGDFHTILTRHAFFDG